MDVEGLERSTVEGVAPSKVLEIDGWLVPLSGGSIGRAKSAVPLRHDLSPEALDAIEAAYAAEGLPPAFRVADSRGLAGVRDALTARGYLGGKLTLVKAAEVGRLAAFHAEPAELLDRPDEAWGAVFLGEGFDPADGASRVAMLSRSPGAVYGQVREGDSTLAVGVATFGHGWAGIHGMRTAQAARGRGYASRILTALGQAAQARGIARVYLQVEEPNPARALYRRAGFEKAWTYRYWQ